MNDSAAAVLRRAGKIPIHGAEAFEGMRKAGGLAARTLDFITPHVRIGTSTGELDRLIDGFMRDCGGIPATLGYRGYPKSSCISINHVVNHGIPDDRRLLKKGDIANIDVTVILDGWYGDTSRMFYAGEPEDVPVRARLLCERTYEAMWAGIDAVRPGVLLEEIGFAIQKVARDNRKGVSFSVVEDYVGHGIGRTFHDAPEVKHYRDAVVRRGKPMPPRGDGAVRLEPGMFFTIEPMINAGTEEVNLSRIDGWTATTRDRKPSAQFEHTVAVTETGVEVFTRSPMGHEQPPYGV